MASSSWKEKVPDVIEEIRAAFDGVSREDGVTLHEAAGFDDRYYSGPVREANRAKDTETRWQDVPDEWIAQMGLGDVALSYLDPKGFRYYLPAYMIWTLKDFVAEIPAETNTELIYALRAPQADWEVEHILQRFSLLSKQQASAVAQFLVLMAQWLDEANAEIAQWRAEAWRIEGNEGHDVSDADDYEPKNEYRNALDAYWCKFL